MRDYPIFYFRHTFNWRNNSTFDSHNRIFKKKNEHDSKIECETALSLYELYLWRTAI